MAGLIGEQAEQAAVVDWLELMSINFFHCPNQRDFARRLDNMNKYLEKQRKLGWRPGVPDLFIVDRPPLFPDAPGAVIEMKYKTNVATADQKKWLATLAAVGWKTSVCWTWGEAVEFLQGLGYGRR